jgi:hypothetical protein
MNETVSTVSRGTDTGLQLRRMTQVIAIMMILMLLNGDDQFTHTT